MERLEIKSFRLADSKEQNCAFEVPFTYYSTLKENGLCDDAFYGCNIQKLIKNQKDSVAFSSDFNLSEVFTTKRSALLRLNRVLAPCRVELNGKIIGECNSSLAAFEFPIKDKIHIGVNTLKLHFDLCGVEKSTNVFDTLNDCGVLSTIEVLAFDGKIIKDVIVETEIDCEKSLNSAKVKIKLLTLGESDNESAVATLISPANSVFYCGFLHGVGEINVNDPNLWNTNGRGEENLYKLSVNLYCDGQVSDTREIYIGLREMSVSDDSKTLYVNGKIHYLKGGFYVPKTHGLVVEKKSVLKRILYSCANAKFNTVYALCGESLPQNDFYHQCDKNGLLVFETLDLDCLSKRCHDLETLIKKHILAIAYHPSLAVIHFKTENEELRTLVYDKLLPFAREYVQNSFVVFERDFIKIYTVPKEEGTDYYLDGRKFYDILAVDGIPSLPNVYTVNSCCDARKTNIFSKICDLHQSEKFDILNILKVSCENFLCPCNVYELTYISELNSALILEEYASAIRNSYTGKGFICGKINESYPIISNSAFDCFGRSKAVPYVAKRFFSDIYLSTKNQGGKVRFTVSNITEKDFEGKLYCELKDSKNNSIFKDERDIFVRSQGTEIIDEIDFYEIIKDRKSDIYLYARVANNILTVSSAVQLFSRIKNFKFEKPNIKTRITGSENEFNLLVTADCFVKNLRFDFGSTDVILEDNYIDIVDSKPIQIGISTKNATSKEMLERQLTLFCLNDCFDI